MKIFFPLTRCRASNNGWNLSSLLMCVQMKSGKFSSLSLPPSLTIPHSEWSGASSFLSQLRRKAENILVHIFPLTGHSITSSTQLSDNRWETESSRQRKRFFTFQWKILSRLSVNLYRFSTTLRNGTCCTKRRERARTSLLYKNGTWDIWAELRLSAISLVTNTLRRYFIIQLRFVSECSGDCCSASSTSLCKKRWRWHIATRFVYAVWAGCNI